MKVQVSHRLDAELVEWADGYARSLSTPGKRVTRSSVIEGGVRALREMAEREVPVRREVDPRAAALRGRR